MCLCGCNSPKPASDDKTPVANVTQPCIPLSHGRSCPSSLPKTCKDAPETIHLPDNLNKAMQDGFKNSFPDGKSQEQGGAIVQDQAGAINVINIGSGTSGTFQPNRTIPSGETIIGTFHTHPYDVAEGDWKGVSFSGADINYARYYKEPIYVDAGSQQYMIMPTEETPTGEIAGDWNKEWADQLKTGKEPPEASRVATNTIAKKYKMAY